MTPAAAPRDPRAWARSRSCVLLLAAVLTAVLTMLAGPIRAAGAVTGPASGAPAAVGITAPALAGPAAETRVGASTVAVDLLVGAGGDIAAGQRRDSVLPQPGFVSATSVAAEDAGGVIYRTGSRTENALTDSSGVSFRDSVSSSTSAENPQVFRPGDKIWGVDTAKLPPGSVVRDGVPAGHVSVFATPEQITGAIIEDPFLSELGLKPLDEFGSFRIPR